MPPHEANRTASKVYAPRGTLQLDRSVEKEEQTDSMTDQPIRRTVLLENHLEAVHGIVNRRFPLLPAHARDGMTKEDFFQDCVLELHRKRDQYDARRGRFITFVYLVVNSFIEHQCEYHNRQKRRWKAQVEFDTRLHGGVIDEEPGSEEETVRLFVLVYNELSDRMKEVVTPWFFTARFARSRKVDQQGRSYGIFKRVALAHGLTSDHCLEILTNLAVRIRIGRRIFTCTTRHDK